MMYIKDENTVVGNVTAGEQENKNVRVVKSREQDNTDVSNVSSGKQESANQRTYKCPTCGKVYRYKSDMERHWRFQCAQKRYYQCSYCGRRSLHSGNLYQHIRRLHPQMLCKYNIVYEKTNKNIK